MTLKVISGTSGFSFVDDKKNLCEFIKLDKSFVDDVIKASNLPRSKKCPFPKVIVNLDELI